MKERKRLLKHLYFIIFLPMKCVDANELLIGHMPSFVWFNRATKGVHMQYKSKFKPFVENVW